jgi:hypothetical protein
MGLGGIRTLIPSGIASPFCWIADAPAVQFYVVASIASGQAQLTVLEPYQTHAFTGNLCAAVTVSIDTGLVTLTQLEPSTPLCGLYLPPLPTPPLTTEQE